MYYTTPGKRAASIPSFVATPIHARKDRMLTAFVLCLVGLIALVFTSALALKARKEFGAPPCTVVDTGLIRLRWGVSQARAVPTWQPLALHMTLFAPHHWPRVISRAFTDVPFMPQPFYDEYRAIDARRLGTSFSLPCLMFQGEADALTPTALAQDYHVPSVSQPKRSPSGHLKSK